MLISSATSGSSYDAASGATSPAAVTGATFSDVLASTQGSEKTASPASPSTMERPSMAQFMALTGCDAQTAVSALYQYNNWSTYLDDGESIDLEEAQEQLAAEVVSGDRISVDGVYGERQDFVEPTKDEPETPGTIVPLFNDVTGVIQGVGFVGQDGTKYTTAAITDKDTIERHATGFGLGQESLENFAQLVGGEQATWATLNVVAVQETCLTKEAFYEKYPDMDIWSRLTSFSG